VNRIERNSKISTLWNFTFFT